MSPYRMDRSEESRTVVVSGVPDVLPSARMTDKLTVHFQSRRRSHGGDVEVVRYPTDLHGVAFVTFDREEDAARVIQKDQQIMTDRKFPKDYPLTVFPFTTEVFYYVANATVDLSMFGSDQSSVLRSLQSAHSTGVSMHNLGWMF
ncbi:RNA-binding protein 43-like isoform X2 [Sphaeramia orbicularis]|uniref:RNA-binding protein 43-like isoform X2 n=1 Tax=Sphaeramia orbicularis TaxID=375764 RepID=UPI00117DCFEC|nr:RNA-binding protein 43 isoform X2 [Sphaeramia orbicularis]